MELRTILMVGADKAETFGPQDFFKKRLISISVTYIGTGSGSRYQKSG
jgi:hypothetical protein